MKNLLYSGDASKNSFNEWLSTWGIWISIIVAAIVFFVVLGLFLYTYFKGKIGRASCRETYFKGKKEGAIIAQKQQQKQIKNEAVLEALGGADNILDHSLNGSRIILVLNNYDAVDQAKLRELGVDSIVKMSNKITLVVKDDSDSFYKLFN